MSENEKMIHRSKYRPYIDDMFQVNWYHKSKKTRLPERDEAADQQKQYKSSPEDQTEPLSGEGTTANENVEMACKRAKAHHPVERSVCEE